MNILHSPPDCLAKAVAKEVGSEGIIWGDSPDPSIYARRYWPKNLLGLPVIAFSTFWTLSAAGYIDGVKGWDREPMPMLFFLWGMIFILFGAGLLFSPFWGRVRAERMYYVLTPNRAIIFERLLFLRIYVIHSHALRGFDRVSYGGDGGDIVFKRTISGSGRSRREHVIGFLGLKPYKSAEAAILRICASKDLTSR